MIVGPAEMSPEVSSGRQLLLTGATGLLGSYLVRDLLLAGERPMVLVRPDRKRDPAARIEAMVAGWEAALGESLPRPTVVAGDLTVPCCGLDTETVRAIGDRCSAIVHNAASLTFHGADRDGEPWVRPMCSSWPAPPGSARSTTSPPPMCAACGRVASWRPNSTSASATATTTSAARSRQRQSFAALPTSAR
ncbi:MAG: NAD-dependent epimerase/dehydratase family protein [Planctomycetia bacterium]|nr:NAD-dependent epimerase/dehydratase family protein [Planctomycetia bacterium]